MLILNIPLFFRMGPKVWHTFHVQGTIHVLYLFVTLLIKVNFNSLAENININPPPQPVTTIKHWLCTTSCSHSILNAFILASYSLLAILSFSTSSGSGGGMYALATFFLPRCLKPPETKQDINNEEEAGKCTQPQMARLHTSECWLAGNTYIYSWKKDRRAIVSS